MYKKKPNLNLYFSNIQRDIKGQKNSLKPTNDFFDKNKIA